MASLLSRLVRRSTGMTIGESIGSAIGGAVGGGPEGAMIGKSIGGGLTEAIDPRRQQQGQAVAVSQAPQTTPQETSESGSFNIVYNQGIEPAVFRSMQIMPPSTQQSGFGVQPAFLKPALQLGGLAVGAAIDLFFIDPITGETKRRRITRKFKSQVKQSVELVGLEETARS